EWSAPQAELVHAADDQERAVLRARPQRIGGSGDRVGHARPCRRLEMKRFAVCLLVLGGACQVRPAARGPNDAPAAPVLRLPELPRRTRYVVGLTVDPARDSFDGDLEIMLELARATDVLWLNASDLSIRSAELAVGRDRLPVRVLAQPADFVGFA